MVAQREKTSNLPKSIADRKTEREKSKVVGGGRRVPIPESEIDSDHG